MKKLFALLVSIGVVAALLSGCGMNGKPQENLGNEIEKGVEQAADKVENTADAMMGNDEKNDNKIADNKNNDVDTSKFIGEEKAKTVALEKAGLKADEVKFQRVELDKDDGVWEYEIEFRKDNTEYEADIKAEDGTILNWDVDND